MATLKRGLVDKVKKVAAKAGTRGARALVETTVAAVKTVDKLQEKLGRHSPKATARQEPRAKRGAAAVAAPPVEPKAKATEAKRTGTAKPRKAMAEAPSTAPRESGRKAMPAVAAKRSKAARTPGFRVKRGQKHSHTGR